MAVHGEALNAVVQNLGQSDNGYVSVGATNPVVSQGFTTGSEADGYELLGIGVNIEGSGSNVPNDAASVSVALHADSSGKPGAKLFDLLSPSEFAAGHSFFEAPAGTTLDPSTAYVLVWTYNAGDFHRLRRTASDGEDPGARADFSIADTLYLGADLDNLAAPAHSNSLEIAVYGRSESVTNASGRPVVLVSAEGGAILAADTSRIADPDGLPYSGTPQVGALDFTFSYQWTRVDAVTQAETEVGADSQRYQLVDADFGNLIKVQVSFTDRGSNPEAVTSLPFGPIAEAGQSRTPSTLVGNTGQLPAATATISDLYAMGFKLGKHGQGYEISSVSIDLAAAPSSLSVSLWTGGPPGNSGAGTRRAKLFDFESPSSFQVGLNEFTAPAGAFAYQNLNHWIVLSDFGDSLSITETTSDAEDGVGETGAILFNTARSGTSSVLRLAVEGSQRTSGILAASFAQPSEGDQEIMSLGDKIAWAIDVGAADRYLVRGVTFSFDDSTPRGGGFTNPFYLRSDSLSGARHFNLVITRDVNGLPTWTAPQGATVAGSNTYVFDWADINVTKPGGIDRMGAILTRSFGVSDDADGQSDRPTALGVSLATGNAVSGIDYAGHTPLMAVHGEPLVAMAQNLGQTDNGYLQFGRSDLVLSQGFTTGVDAFGYRLQGIGVNIEGSDSHFPDDSASVSVAVHADTSGQPGAKLFDLVSPTEYRAGHSFFEAPPGAYLDPSTAYVLVWSHISGTPHRLRKTKVDAEDAGARAGASIANEFYQGAPGQADPGLDRRRVGDRGVHRGLADEALQGGRIRGADPGPGQQYRTGDGERHQCHADQHPAAGASVHHRIGGHVPPGFRRSEGGRGRNRRRSVRHGRHLHGCLGRTGHEGL